MFTTGQGYLHSSICWHSSIRSPLTFERHYTKLLEWEATPQWEDEWKTSCAVHASMWYILSEIYVPHVHNPQNSRFVWCCRFEGQIKTTWIYRGLFGQLLSGKGCSSFIQTKLFNLTTHWHWMGYKFLIVGTIFNLAKVETVSCSVQTLSLGQRVDDWIV